mmetsp:Transcript_13415/g.35194  ORF Transcript_13415/g.35194 Transcript_13415/m.35194 type:complete len:262 (-) Transcript_13415:316-1101(-)|eukprot:CAMPEP_0113906352 /NCGR_PEP_ID=MMETSP0780_2-20120614/24686_1 /TAXON_ID=652834 /ORGANISM="Palpitomonas bilix" /LENGTH=261 /DNA_ID=CAMNT_0000900915 /DNA_START=74 /DNA_END=859 /DNA_ORIENTATION=- /assembly_acc=CAM_ASM_000599
MVQIESISRSDSRLETIPVLPYIAKQKKETTSRRGKDLKPRRRRSYKQLQEETREYHFCPCDGCDRKYVGSYGSFNLFVHVKNKHYNGTLEPGSLQKRKIEIVPVPAEDGGQPTQARHVTYALLNPEEVKESGSCSTPEVAAKTEPKNMIESRKPLPLKKSIPCQKKEPAHTAVEIEEMKRIEKLKFLQDSLRTPGLELTPLPPISELEIEAKHQPEMECEVSVLPWDPENLSDSPLSSEHEGDFEQGSFDLNLDELFSFN